jgi:hypothetical protein
MKKEQEVTIRKLKNGTKILTVPKDIQCLVLAFEVDANGNPKLRRIKIGLDSFTTLGLIRTVQVVEEGELQEYALANGKVE